MALFHHVPRTAQCAILRRDLGRSLVLLPLSCLVFPQIGLPPESFTVLYHPPTLAPIYSVSTHRLQLSRPPRPLKTTRRRRSRGYCTGSFTTLASRRASSVTVLAGPALHAAVAPPAERIALAIALVRTCSMNRSLRLTRAGRSIWGDLMSALPSLDPLRARRGPPDWPRETGKVQGYWMTLHLRRTPSTRAESEWQTPTTTTTQPIVAFLRVYQRPQKQGQRG